MFQRSKLQGIWKELLERYTKAGRNDLFWIICLWRQISSNKRSLEENIVCGGFVKFIKIYHQEMPKTHRCILKYLEIVNIAYSLSD